MAGKKSSRCPECGAREGTCTARFEEFLAREFQDPAYGAVHHLTVAAYMLQHSSHLTREGWLYERELLGDFLVHNKPVEQARAEGEELLDSGKRKFKIKSRDGAPLFPRFKWARTILDVHFDTPSEYCEAVTAWARATLADCEKIEV